MTEWAFPWGEASSSSHSPGLTLRDFFAAAALGHIVKLCEIQGKNLTAHVIARWAYEMADAMLEAEKMPSMIKPTRSDPLTVAEQERVSRKWASYPRTPVLAISGHDQDEILRILSTLKVYRELLSDSHNLDRIDAMFERLRGIEGATACHTS